jgi:uncharacterized membrane protein
MHITRTTLKSEAKRKLSGQTKPSAIVTFVTWLLPTIAGPSGIAPLIFDGPFGAGMAQFFLRLVRGEAPGVGTMFLGFSKFLRNIRVWLMQLVFVLLWALLLIVPGVIAGLRYSMVWFVLADEPELTARQAMDRSKALTKGRLRDLFVLGLSFFWWLVFGIITLGIGFLYVVPYVQTTWALVYEGMRVAEVPASDAV